MKKPRKRAAHLGSFLYDNEEYRATFRRGKLTFKQKHARKAKAVEFTLSEIFHLAQGQRLLPLPL